MADQPLVNQNAIADPAHAECCGEAQIQMISTWCGRPVSAQAVIDYLESIGGGEPAVGNGTSGDQMVAAWRHFGFNVTPVSGPVGDAFAAARARGHIAMGVVFWDGAGNLGGPFAHWVSGCPSGRVANSWGPQYDAWSQADLDVASHTEHYSIEINHTEGSLAPAPEGEPLMAGSIVAWTWAAKGNQQNTARINHAGLLIHSWRNPSGNWSAEVVNLGGAVPAGDVAVYEVPGGYALVVRGADDKLRVATQTDGGNTWGPVLVP